MWSPIPPSADEAARRLGDGRYESRLISDAVLAQTGQRFLANGLSDDNEQFRYLMDNALASKNELNLSLGINLTSEQVAALTHDIKVNGDRPRFPDKESCTPSI